MSKYLITYKHPDNAEPVTLITDLHPADWIIANAKAADARLTILFSILITDTQYEKLAELGYT